MVLTAHVHDYQRIERNLVNGTATPFVVSGNGGYYNLHKIASPVGTVDPATQAKLVAGYDQSHGYMILTVGAKTISGVSYSAGAQSTPHEVTSQKKKKKQPPQGGGTSVDTFSYPAASQVLPDGVNVTL